MKKRGLRPKLMLAAKITLVVFLCIGAIGASVVAYFAKDLPNPEKLATLPLSQSTKIYDRTGTVVLYDIYGEEKRTVTNLNDVPQHVIDATIAAEDERFYGHFGVDLKAVLRAAVANIRRQEISEGASTITQQLIKASFLSPERTWTRKIREAILAIVAELRYSKDQILEMYLNQVSYGSNAYGIEAASNTFFNKPARDLTIAEGALLASLLKATTYYSPFGSHLDELLARKNRTIDRMAELGFISKTQAEESKQERFSFNRQVQAIKAPHFVFYVREYLSQRYGDDFVQRAGLKVITTLDWDLQQEAERIISEGAETNEQLYGASNAALISLNPKTGQVIAMVGSRDYFNDEIDGNVNVTIRPRSPGSAIKPLVYAAAFKRGFSDKTVLFDVPTDFPVEVPGEKPYQPDNYDEKFVGPITVRHALAQSRNVPSVKVLYLAGIENALRTAEDLGITTLQDRSRYYLSLVLGGAELKPIELAGAYGALAQDGILHTTTPILRIEDASGTVLEEYRDESKRALEASIARQVTSILSDNEARTPVFGPRSPLFIEGKLVAAKTGTSQDYYDAWVVGYTPSIVTAVWAGNNKNDRRLTRQGAGIAAAGPLWNEFMRYALGDGPAETFPLPPEPQLPEKPMLNGEWRQPGGIHSILFFVDVNDPLGPPPQDPAKDGQFLAWETGVMNWLMKEGLPSNAATPGNILPNSPITITITTPVPNQVVVDGNVQIWVEATSPSQIRQVDFFFDGRLVGTVFGAPYQLSFPVPAYETYSQGFYDIKARVYDRSGNLSEAVQRVFLQK